MSKPTCYVIDCWDVRSPDEFWDHYIREVGAEDPNPALRTPDEFRSTLIHGGPGFGWPGCPCELEVIHVDKLLANGHSDFIAFLKKLGAELRALGPSRMIELRMTMPPRLRADGPRVIKLMADYYCHPLWEVAPDIDNIDPATLPLSDGTQAALRRWAAAFDETLNDEDPRDSGFGDAENEAAFEAEGHRLWRTLQLEIGEEARVVYYSEMEQRVLEPEVFREPGMIKTSTQGGRNESSFDLFGDALTNHESVVAFYAFAMRALNNDDPWAGDNELQQYIDEAAITPIDPAELRHEVQVCLASTPVPDFPFDMSEVVAAHVARNDWNNRELLWTTPAMYCLLWWGTSL